MGVFVESPGNEDAWRVFPMWLIKEGRLLEKRNGTLLLAGLAAALEADFQPSERFDEAIADELFVRVVVAIARSLLRDYARPSPALGARALGDGRSRSGVGGVPGVVGLYGAEPLLAGNRGRSRARVPPRFAAGFEAGFEWIERRQPGWRSRRTIRALDAVLELIEDLVKSDPKAAQSYADRVLCLVSVAQLRPIGRPASPSCRDQPPSPDPRQRLSWTALEGMAYAVLASTLTALGQTDISQKILHAMSQRDLPKAIQGSVVYRRAVASVECKAWLDAERFANAAVSTNKTANFKTWWKTPYRSLASALLTRSYVVGLMYEYGVAGVERLEEVAIDAIRTAKLARDAGFREVEAMALNTLARAGALGAFDGYALDIEMPPIARGSVHWSKARWTTALVLCARTGELTPPAEAAFREAREDFECRGLVDEAVCVTLDLQWWLLAGGASRRAALESVWLLEHLEAMSFDCETVRLWIRHVERRRISTQLVEAVYREVRGLPRVSGPAAARLRRQMH